MTGDTRAPGIIQEAKGDEDLALHYFVAVYSSIKLSSEKKKIHLLFALHFFGGKVLYYEFKIIIF